MSLFFQNARIVLGAGKPALGSASLRVAGGKVVALGAVDPEPGDRVIDADGRVLMPGFVDAHTHALWVGSRIDEFEQQQRGRSYLEILKSGGGILSTVRAVQAASEAELTAALRERLDLMLREGTTTVEVKSGYGLETEAELKMLRAIARARDSFPGTVTMTALLGHAILPGESNFVERVVSETLPAVHAEFPDISVDAYCEDGAWSVADCRRLFERARELGHPIRLHADQFNSLGGLELAVGLGARSVDHLEATTNSALRHLAESPTYGVMLPACGFHSGARFADARAFLDAHGKLALGTNCNPGSAPTSSMPFVIALAVRHLRLDIAEALHATTTAPARLLGFEDRGQITAGARADLIMLWHRDERALGYEFGGNPVKLVVAGGNLI